MFDIDLLQLERLGYARLDQALEIGLLDQAIESARQAFALDPSIKHKYRSKDEGYGYKPHGSPRIAGGPPDDSRELWDVGRRSENRLPAEVPNFVPTISRLQLALERIAGNVLAKLDREWSLDLAKLAFDGRMPLRIIHYRDRPAGEILLPHHRDFSLITLYACSTCPGLEFEIDHVWQRPDQPKGSVLVAAGSILRQYRRRPRALRHRVVATEGPRLSISMFVETHPDVVLPNGTRTSDIIHHIMSAHADD